MHRGFCGHKKDTIGLQIGYGCGGEVKEDLSLCVSLAGGEDGCPGQQEGSRDGGWVEGKSLCSVLDLLGLRHLPDVQCEGSKWPW